ncbi:MAG: toxin-antitoxin system HicB family antitoxin [Pirellulales bacterium]|nr:toxin-antitoxin system HicB family antitoxin [Pirellulales bacterium]
MKSRKPFLLRVSPALHREIEAWARQELRSVNGQIEYLLQEAVRRRRRAIPAEAAAPRDRPPGDEDSPPRPESTSQ